ncbi:hypothetical protein Nepgr_012841 [Nepenthes gracilis]|uniref:Uncharacterized protein n=1 Tax=Nepenthes gracilis TaxID=150966 RepID=A0AAD3SGG7_NEPGR|nr:hypothetical protein Nepgr_012841 [Nepenthes gracilis]
MKNCILISSDNGVMIKTWLNSNESIPSELHFDHIIMINVLNPIIPDQTYCPYNHCEARAPRVKLSNVSFKKIRGTSSAPVAVKLICSSGMPCEKVELMDIDLTYAGK